MTVTSKQGVMKLYPSVVLAVHDCWECGSIMHTKLFIIIVTICIIVNIICLSYELMEDLSAIHYNSLLVSYISMQWSN